MDLKFDENLDYKQITKDNFPELLEKVEEVLSLEKNFLRITNPNAIPSDEQKQALRVFLDLAHLADNLSAILNKEGSSWTIAKNQAEIFRNVFDALTDNEFKVSNTIELTLGDENNSSSIDLRTLLPEDEDMKFSIDGKNLKFENLPELLENDESETATDTESETATNNESETATDNESEESAKKEDAEVRRLIKNLNREMSTNHINYVKSARDNPRAGLTDIVEFLRQETKYTMAEIIEFTKANKELITQLEGYNEYLMKIKFAASLSLYSAFLGKIIDRYDKIDSNAKDSIVKQIEALENKRESIDDAKKSLLGNFKQLTTPTAFKIGDITSAAKLKQSIEPKVEMNHNATLAVIITKIPQDKRTNKLITKDAYEVLDKLKSIGAKSSINETIKTLKTLDKSIYTDEINEKLNNKNVTQEDLNDIITELSSNMVALITKSKEDVNKLLIKALEAYKSLASVIYANDNNAKETAKKLIQGKIDSLKNGTEFKSNDELIKVLEKLKNYENTYNPNNDSKLPFDRLLADKNNLIDLAQNLVTHDNDYNIDTKSSKFRSFENLRNTDTINEKELGELLNTIIELSDKILKEVLDGRNTITKQQEEIKTLNSKLKGYQKLITTLFGKLKSNLSKRYQEKFQQHVDTFTADPTERNVDAITKFYSKHCKRTRIILLSILSIALSGILALVITLNATADKLFNNGQNAVQNYEDAIIAAATTDAEDGNRKIEYTSNISLINEIPEEYIKSRDFKDGFDSVAKPIYEAKYYYKLGYSDGVAAGKIANESGEYKELDTANIPAIDGLSKSYDDNYKEGYAAGYNATHKKTVTKIDTITVDNTDFEKGLDEGITQGEQIANDLNASPASSTQDPLERHYMQYGGEASNKYVDGYNKGLQLGFDKTINEKQNTQPGKPEEPSPEKPSPENPSVVNYSVEDILDTLRTHTKFENPEIYEIKVNAASNSLIIITKEGSRYKKTTVTANDSSLIQKLNSTAFSVKQDDNSTDDQNYLNAFYNVFLGASEITTNSYVVVESENVGFDHLQQYAASNTNGSVKSEIEQLNSSGEAVKIHISILDKKAVVYATSGTHELSVEFETPANVSKNYIIDSLENIFIGSAAEKNEAEAKFIVNEITLEENAQLNAIYIFNANTAESTVS